MGFDNTDHEKRGGTAKSPPPPDDTADTSTGTSAFYSFILTFVGAAAGVIGLNMMMDSRGQVSSLSSEPLAAVGLFVAGVGLLVVGVVLPLTGRTPQNMLPFDVDFIPEEPEDGEVEPGNWANLYLAAFLMYSLLFFSPGALIVYEALTVENWLVHGEILLGILFLILGTVVVDSALMGRDGDTLGLWINGGIAAVMTVFGGYMLRVDLVGGHSPTPGLLTLSLSLVGVATAAMAYREHGNTGT